MVDNSYIACRDDFVERYMGRLNNAEHTEKKKD